MNGTLKPFKFHKMKHIICFSLLVTLSVALFAQDKQVDFELKKCSPSHFLAAGDDSFFLIGGSLVNKSNAGPVISGLKVILKFNADLKPVWKEPIWVKNPGITIINGEDNTKGASVFAYTSSIHNTSIDYVTGGKDIVQIMQDGTVKEIEAKIPKKEVNEKAAEFVDANGLNMITIVGDETFPTGSLNWYTFSHENLTQTKRTIKLPMPSGIDKDNESGWRLNEVTSSGLYFYYVSYKNKVADNARPILTCHIVHVDMEGRAEKVIDVDMGVEKYNIFPCGYQQEHYAMSRAINPPIFEPGRNSIETERNHSATQFNLPTDNAYMGIKIDEAAKLVYTVTASNDELKVDKNGEPKMSQPNYKPVKELDFCIYDFAGKKISQTQLKPPASKLESTDDYSAQGNRIEIKPLPNNEGVICKFINNGNGVIWALNNLGEIIKEQKIKLQTDKYWNEYHHNEVFASPYYSMKHFMSSPYVHKENSAAYQKFQKLPEKEKNEALFISLKQYELLAVWDPKKNTIHFSTFDKK